MTEQEIDGMSAQEMRDALAKQMRRINRQRAMRREDVQTALWMAEALVERTGKGGSPLVSAQQRWSAGHYALAAQGLSNVAHAQYDR